MELLDDKRPNGYCCCARVHIRNAALIVTLLTLVDSIWDLTLWSRGLPIPYWVPAGFVWHYGFSGAIRMLVSIIGFYAYLKRVSWAWLPVTIFRGLEAPYDALFAAVHVVLYFAHYPEQWIQSDPVDLQRSSVAVIAAVLVLGTLLSAWFATVTYRAFKWQKSEEKMNNDYIGVEAALGSVEESLEVAR